MKTLKETREQKALRVQMEQDEKKAMEFAARARRSQAMLVMKDSWDGPVLETIHVKFGQAMASLLYDVVSDAQRLRKEVMDRSSTMRRRLDELDHYMTVNRFPGGSAPVYNAEEINVDYLRFYDAAQRAHKLTHALGVFVPSLYDAETLEKRALLLSHDVMALNNYWIVTKNNVEIPPRDDGARTYDTEWQAWAAVQALTGGRN